MQPKNLQQIFGNVNLASRLFGLLIYQRLTKPHVSKEGKSDRKRIHEKFISLMFINVRNNIEIYMQLDLSKGLPRHKVIQ